MASEKTVNSRLTKGMKYAEQYNIKAGKREEYASAYADYVAVTKMADQKLRRLEALSHEEHFENVLSFGYARAQKDIAKWKGEEYNADSKYGRFSTAPPPSLAQLYAKINDAERFINMKTSDKSGVKKMYMKRANTLNEKYSLKAGGVKLTWEEVAKFFEKDYMKKLEKNVSSASQVIALGVIKRYGLEDEDIFNEIVKLRADENYAKDVIENFEKKGKKIKGLSKEETKETIDKYNFIQRENKDSKFIKSPKIQRDIQKILETEGVDLKTLFEDSKKKGK